MATVVAFAIGAALAVAAMMTIRRRAESRTEPQGPVGKAYSAVGDNTSDGIDVIDDGRLVAALDALPMGVVLVDVAGREVVRNRAAGAALQRHQQVLVDAAVAELLEGSRRGGSDLGTTLELQGPHPRVLALAAHPLRDGGALATVTDVTERARLDAVRTDFVANLSHELKTPVGALAVLAETLADVVGAESLDPDDRAAALRLAGKLVAEAHRLSGSIDELLELSRIELEGDEVRAPVRADVVVCDAVERVRHLAEPAAIRVNTCLPAEPIEFPGDGRQLASAMGNLLENAVKYSDPSGTVEIGVREADEVIEFWVRDWGVGIPARDLDRIFERFYRVDRARSRDTGGTGLGLSIVRHVATNHGGTVNVVSHEGEGSTFTLRVPRTAHDPEEDR